MKKEKFSSIESIIKIAKKGGMYILVDDENRENEGDLVFCSSDVNAKKIKLIDKSYLIEFLANSTQKKNLVEKASILINGVSLTISKVTKYGFEVWVIPHTYKLTNLSKLKKNSLVNVEIDILSKYVRKYFNEK